MMKWLVVGIGVIAAALLAGWRKSRYCKPLLILGALIVCAGLSEPLMKIAAKEYDTPEEVFYQEHSQAEGKVLLVLRGKDSAWVVGQQADGKIEYGIIAKSGEKWTRTVMSENVLVKMTPTPAAGIFLYRYADTGDYYVMLLDNGNGGIGSAADSMGSEFHGIEGKTNLYAYVPGVSSDYWVEVNDERVDLFR